jgi:hypothetical protein
MLMMDANERRRIQDALGWCQEIGCCSDKERYALRIMGLFDDLGIARSVPCEVETALRELQNWEECAGPCRVIDAFLEGLLDASSSSGSSLRSIESPPLPGAREERLGS